MRRRRQRLGEVRERRGWFDSCHPEAAAFGTVGPVYFAVSSGAAGKRLAKSFVRNILRVSHCRSRFCGELKLSRKRKSIDMNILPGTLENNRAHTSQGKSLSWKILRVKSLESRFCADVSGSRKYKLFEIKILAGVI